MPASGYSPVDDRLNSLDAAGTDSFGLAGSSALPSIDQASVLMGALDRVLPDKSDDKGAVCHSRVWNAHHTDHPSIPPLVCHDCAGGHALLLRLYGVVDGSPLVFLAVRIRFAFDNPVDSP